MTHLRSFPTKTVSAIFPLPRESDTVMTGLPAFPSYFHDFRINPWENATAFPSRFTMEESFGTSVSPKASASVAIV